VRFFGTLFTAAGLFIVIGAIVRPDVVYFVPEEGGTPTEQWLSILFGICFLLPGLFGLRAHRLIWPDADQARAVSGWAAAMLVMFGGTLIASAIWYPDDTTFPVGRWAAGLAGVLFVVFAMAVAIPASRSAFLRHTIGHFLGVTIFTLFGVIFALIGFHGEKDVMAMSIGVVLLTVSAYGWYRGIRGT
jgi:hypothetical protein